MPTISLTAIRTHAATTETRAVRRWGLTDEASRFSRLLRRDGSQRPDEHVLPSREAARAGRAERQVRRGHRVLLDRGFGLLQRPEWMMDLGAMEATAIGGVEAVALGEEPVQRARLGVEGLAGRPVAAVEAPVGCTGPRTRVGDVRAARLHGHPCMEIRQLVVPTGGLDGQAARRVQAEEPDAGPLFRRHVSKG